MGRMVIIGVDGLSSNQWASLSSTDVMPRSAELIRSGTFVPMQSSIPEVSSAAWVSIVTGTNPGVHNIYGFTDIMDGTYTMGFTSSRTLKVPPFWQRQNGRRNLIMNVPQSYPALPMEGLLVSGFVAPDLEKAVYPPEKLPIFKEMGYELDIDMETARESKELFYSELSRVLLARVKTLDRLWSSENWDTIMFVVTCTDRLNHVFWSDWEDENSQYHQRYLDFHSLVDQVIGSIVDRLEADDTLVIVSDHGFERQEISVNINSLLVQLGYLKLREAQFLSPACILQETKAFALDPGRIYLHFSGKYPRGSVPREDAAGIEEKLIRDFQSFEINGRKIVRQIHRGREIYSGPFLHRAPSLVLMPAEGITFSARFQSDDIVEESQLTGKHRFDNAVFYYRGPAEAVVPEPMKVEHVLGVINPVQARDLSKL